MAEKINRRQCTIVKVGHDILALVGDNSFLCSADGQRAGLGHAHNGCKVLHAVHAKVCHRERPGLHL